MKSLLQAKYRLTLIIKCFRYNLYIIGSHFGERFTNIAKMAMGGGKSHSRYPNPKSQNPPPPPPPPGVLFLPSHMPTLPRDAEAHTPRHETVPLTELPFDQRYRHYFHVPLLTTKWRMNSTHLASGDLLVY